MAVSLVVFHDGQYDLTGQYYINLVDCNSDRGLNGLLKLTVTDVL